MAVLSEYADNELKGLAQRGSMDYSKWPTVLDSIGPRLEHIVYNEFPMPLIPVRDPRSISTRDELQPDARDTSMTEEPPEKRARIEEDSTEATSSNPNDQPNTTQESAPSSSPRGTKRSRSPPSNHPPATIPQPPNTLPPTLLTLLRTIQSTLQTSFTLSPPHTAQRLAELLLHPTQHYRTLPSYLRALDRIVCVASPASVFPLPNIGHTATTNGSSSTFLNGTLSPSPSPADKDFIGGAELTPIPWLRHPTDHDDLTNSSSNENGNGNGALPGSASSSSPDLRTESTSLIDGPNGAGSIETVTIVNGTHVPSPDNNHSSPNNNRLTRSTSSSSPSSATTVSRPTPTLASSSSSPSTASPSAAAASSSSSSASASAETMVEAGSEEQPHARGPNLIGVADMGPQDPGSGLAGGIVVSETEGWEGGSRDEGRDRGAVRGGEVEGEGDDHHDGGNRGSNGAGGDDDGDGDGGGGGAPGEREEEGDDILV